MRTRKTVQGRHRPGRTSGMTDEPRHRPRRRNPLRVEPLEGRTLLSAARAATPPGQVQVVISPSNPYVNEEERSFTVTLHLKKTYNPQAAATLNEPLTVDFTASSQFLSIVPPEAASPVFVPFHSSVTFPAGASSATV